jgi:hypothetical protein
MSGAIDPKKEWDKNPQNPYAATLTSGSANLSSSIVIEKYNEVYQSFTLWSIAPKTSNLPYNREECVVLLYSGETERLMEHVAEYIATKHNLYVLTAPNIFEKGSGNRIAFQPFPGESLNGLIRRIINASKCAIILYTEQGGQIIETSWCSDLKISTLGLMQFYRGRGTIKEGENICQFLKQNGEIFQCTCSCTDKFQDKIGAYICMDRQIFCPFTQQENITKMIFDIYIMNQKMSLFGAENRPDLIKPIDDFLMNKL